MWQCPDALDQIKAVKDRPGRWIQTIAANFFPGKCFSFKNECSQTRERAKRRAGGSGRTRAHNRHIEGFHRR
jgi:hypothetical protein